MKRKIKFSIIGAIGFVLAIICLAQDEGEPANWQFYGGDAFTGIQNASADAANNILALTKMVKTGFATLLFFFSLSSFVYGFFPDTEAKEKTQKESEATTSEEDA